ncbi:hypothetical protein [Solilutibacter silvestris]|uniref:hypothetical protein n=1 Tax=Solilutibacter silvestris TaxID=1645665 RepID=UPI003D32A2F1
MLITIARFLDRWEAEIVCARLKAEGIPATTAFANHATIDWPISFALGGTAVQIPEEFSQDALEVLDAYQSGELQGDLEQAEDLPAESCPKCGGLSIRYGIPLQQRALALVTGLLGATFPTSTSAKTCETCSFSWEGSEG